MWSAGGGDTSAVKTGMASVMGTLQGMSTKIAKDELIKNTLHDYGTEHLEIACYTSLMAAARELDDPETVRICEQILAEEQAMAEFLFQQIPTATREMLQLEATAASR